MCAVVLRMLLITAFIIFMLAVTAYAAPGVIAILRGHKRWLPIVTINVLFGWTIVGWVVALAMALELRLHLPKRQQKARARTASIAPSVAQAIGTAENPAPSPEHVEPPAVRDDSYAGWLENGAALQA